MTMRHMLTLRQRLLLGAALVALSQIAAPRAFAADPGALPTGGQIVGGGGTISVNGSRMDVNQTG